MKSFIVGGLYFMINYSDPRLLFPTPMSMIFIGKNIDGEDGPNSWYFQDTDSYCSKGLFVNSRNINRKKDKARLYVVNDNQLHQVVDCGCLAEILLECRARRAKAGQPN
jgi:hypothetical protein